jgi:hypothetical protein
MTHASTREEADFERVLADFLSTEISRADALSSVDQMVSRLVAHNVPVRRRTTGPGRFAWILLSLLLVVALAVGTAAILGTPRFVVPVPVPTRAATQRQPEASGPSDAPPSLATASPAVSPSPTIVSSFAGTVAVATGAAIIAVDALSGAQVQVLTCPSSCYNGSTPTWSPDGRQMAYMVGGEIRIRDLVSGQDRAIVECGSSGCAQPGYLAWSPDGSTLAYFGGGNLTTVPVAGGPVRQLTHDHAGLPDALRVLQWTPDSRSLRYEINGTRHQIDRDGSNAKALAPVGTNGGWVTTAPDGTVAYVSDESQVPEPGQTPQPDPFVAELRVISPGSIEPVVVARQPGCCLGASIGGAPAWSPDSRQIAWVVYAGNNSGQHHLIVANSDGSGSRVVMTTDANRPDWYPIPRSQPAPSPSEAVATPSS